MTKEEIEAQLALEKLNRSIELKKEFESLAPSARRDILKTLSVIATMLLVLWLYPSIMEQPISYLLLILVFAVSTEAYRESKRINKRIDALYKLLKNDV